MVAGDGPKENPRAGECRTEPIPEARWRRLEELLRDAQRARQEPITVKTPDTAVREVLGEAVRWYAAAPVRRGLLPWTEVSVRACARRVAAAARQAVRLRIALWFPRGKDTMLPWILMRECLGYDPTIWVDSPIQGAELTLLAERAARMAKSYRDPDARTNFARVELVAQVVRVIEVRVGGGAATLGWNEKDDRVTGLLSDMVWELLPSLPGFPSTPRGLYEALLAARTIVGRRC